MTPATPRSSLIWCAPTSSTHRPIAGEGDLAEAVKVLAGPTRTGAGCAGGRRTCWAGGCPTALEISLNDLPEPHKDYGCDRSSSDIPGRPNLATAHLHEEDGVALTG